MKRLLCLLLGLSAIVRLGGQAVDSLLSVYETGERTASLAAANCLNKILFEEEFCDSAEVFTKRTDALVVQARLLAPLSDWLFSRQRYGEAYDAAKRALAAAEIIKDDRMVATSCSTLAACSQQFGNFKEAVEYAERCHELDVRLSDTLAICSSLNNLAVICLSSGHERKAKDYIDKAIVLERPLGRPDVLAIRLGVAAEVYMALGLYDRALDFAQEAYSLNTSTGNTAKAAVRLCQKGAVYQKMGELDNARRIYLDAVGPLTLSGNIRSLSICLNSLGALSVQQKRTAEAERFFLQALEIADGNNGYRLQAQKACDALARLYAPSQPSKAVDYYQRSAELRDSLFNEESERQINDFNVQYGTQEKEQQIELQQVKLEHQNSVQKLLVLVLALFTLLLVLLVVLMRVQRRRYKEQKEINEVKCKFFSVISHDLKNPVIAQKNAIEMICSNYDSIPSDVLLQQCKELMKSAEALIELLFNLLNWSRLQTGKIRFEPSRFDLRAVSNDVRNLVDGQLKAKSQTLETEAEGESIAFADREMVATVLRNLVSNAIKFSYPDGKIVISIVRSGKMWNVSVKDRGVGMDDSTKDSLFKLNSKLASGTASEHGSGLGLIICKEMVERNGGRISVESRKGEGTSVTFSLNASRI